MERIRIGQIGIGHNHGEGKMLSLRKLGDRFDVIGYAEEDEDWIARRGGLAAYAGLPRMSVDALIDRADAVVIESDVRDLTRYAKRCIDAGKHIHMDKPASGRYADYCALLEAAEKKRLVVQMGYMYRYNPAVQRCMEMIRGGELGEILSVNAEMSTFHPADYRCWLAGFPGGVMYIMGSHLVDLVVAILGAPEKVTAFLKRSGLDGVDVADNTLAVLEYEKAIARIYVSSVEFNGWGRRQLVVAGTRGTVQIMPLESPCRMTFAHRGICWNSFEDIKETVDVPDLPRDCRYDGMLRHFYDYVRGTEQNPFSYAHDAAVQRTIERICGGEK